jgi:pSer/pThr/pTyr-binding forkhead associated (FHA) protein
MGTISARPPRSTGHHLDKAPPAPTSNANSAATQSPPASAPARPQAVVCPRCSGVNDTNSRFCKHCGISLQSSPPRSISSTTVGGAAAKPQKLLGQIAIILRNGSEGKIYPLQDEMTDIGSREGQIILGDDPYLSPRHARIAKKENSFVLRDLGSINGIFLRIRESVELSDDDTILLGQQVLKFQYVPDLERNIGPASQHGVMVFGTPETQRIARIIQYTTEGLQRDVYYLSREETVLGREQADIVFPDDAFLSRRHAAIVLKKDNMRFSLRDLGSSNGTAIRCRRETLLSAGDQFRVGRHLFRFDFVEQ